MPRLDNLLQTVQDRENPDYVNANGPFLSTNNHWLGKGYYFWDGILARAHWWGETHCHRKYMICCAWADIDEGAYLDLAGNMKQLEDFKSLYNLICQMHPKRTITISFVINKLIKKNLFPYQAVRSLSNKCGGDDSVAYVDYHSSFFNFSPPMQICVYCYNRIREYHVIYPTKYTVTGLI